jgi:hypothetical protein
VVRRLRGQESDIRRTGPIALLAEDGTHVLFASEGDLLWQRVADGGTALRLPIGADPLHMALAGRRAVVWTADARLLLVDLEAGTLRHVAAPAVPLVSVGFAAPDGTAVLLMGEEGRGWRMPWQEGDAVPLVLPGGRAPGLEAVAAPGRNLVVGVRTQPVPRTGEGEVVIWQGSPPLAVRRIVVPRGAGQEGLRVAVRADGRQVLLHGEVGMLERLVLDVPARQAVLDAACARVPRRLSAAERGALDLVETMAETPGERLLAALPGAVRRWLHPVPAPRDCPPVATPG